MNNNRIQFIRNLSYWAVPCPSLQLYVHGKALLFLRLFSLLCTGVVLIGVL